MLRPKPKIICGQGGSVHFVSEVFDYIVIFVT
jgi:hypothetical protein